VLRIVLISLFGLFATGCGIALQVQRQEARTAYQAEIAECNRLYPDKYLKPATPRVKCFTDAAIRMAERGADPNMDLARAMTTQMMVIAERYDNGRLSPAQFDAEKAAAFADYRTRLIQRHNSTVMANAAADQAAAAWAASCRKAQRAPVLATL
jgi:hypothetical protein